MKTFVVTHKCYNRIFGTWRIQIEAVDRVDAKRKAWEIWKQDPFLLSSPVTGIYSKELSNAVYKPPVFELVKQRRIVK